MICPNDANNDFDDMLCRDCDNFNHCFQLWQNDWKKEKAQGDNFPKFDKLTDKIELNRQIQEVKNSINIIGEYSTWEMIEAIADVKLRLRYRFIFLKLGGKAPEKEI